MLGVAPAAPAPVPGAGCRSCDGNPPDVAVDGWGGPKGFKPPPPPLLEAKEGDSLTTGSRPLAYPAAGDGANGSAPSPVPCTEDIQDPKSDISCDDDALFGPLDEDLVTEIMEA